jgi:hypothetical protein
MPTLSDAELKMVAEVVTELAKLRGTSLDKAAKGFAFARAALIDPAFKAKLAEVHRRLEARRSTNIPHCWCQLGRCSAILSVTPTRC